MDTRRRRHGIRRTLGIATVLGTALSVAMVTGGASAATVSTPATAPAAQQAAGTHGRHGAAQCGPIDVAYVEVNNDDIGNVGRYTLKDGSNAFDVAIIFAANINYDGTRAQLYLNDNVQRTVNDQATIRALQRRGIKVTLSVLGNHQGAGIANFTSRRAAEGFAAQVTKAVRTYHLDGVDLDDEYSEYGKNGTAQPNDQSIGWLVTALRRDMPNKIVSYYDIGPSSAALAKSPAWIGRELTYATNPYYGSYRVPQIPGLSKAKLAPAAVDIQNTPVSRASELAQRTVADGYGVFTTYNLPDGNSAAYVSALTTQLFGQPATYSARIPAHRTPGCQVVLSHGQLHKTPAHPVHR